MYKFIRWKIYQINTISFFWALPKNISLMVCRMYKSKLMNRIKYKFLLSLPTLLAGNRKNKARTVSDYWNKAQTLSIVLSNIMPSNIIHVLSTCTGNTAVYYAGVLWIPALGTPLIDFLQTCCQQLSQFILPRNGSRVTLAALFARHQLFGTLC